MTSFGPFIASENDYNDHFSFFEQNLITKNSLVEFLLSNTNSEMKKKIFYNLDYISHGNVTVFVYNDEDIFYEPFLITRNMIPLSLITLYQSFKINGLNNNPIFIQNTDGKTIVNNNFYISNYQIIENSIVYFLNKI